MEEEVCNHQKFGFCKFKEQCKKKHLKETCKDLSSCADPKGCNKRHPRGCKGYALEGFCRFGDGCWYHHKEVSTNKDISEVKKKVEELEKVINKMAEQIVILEVELDVIKQKENVGVKIKEATKNIDKTQENDKCKESEAENFDDIGKAKVSKSVKKLKAELNKAISIKKHAYVKKVMSCDLCEYKCKKIVTLKKHMTNNHTDQKDDYNNGCSSEDDIFCLSEIKEHMAKKVKPKKSFVFSESMLDEFDPLLK